VFIFILFTESTSSLLLRLHYSRLVQPPHSAASCVHTSAASCGNASAASCSKLHLSRQLRHLQQHLCGPTLQFRLSPPAACIQSKTLIYSRLSQARVLAGQIYILVWIYARRSMLWFLRLKYVFFCTLKSKCIEIRCSFLSNQLCMLITAFGIVILFL
jgi:hypothetical protein